jgi:hypothetical protein
VEDVYLPNKCDDLDRAGDNLDFTVKVDGQVVEHNDRDKADGDPDGRGEVGPVLDDEGSGGQLGSEGDGVAGISWVTGDRTGLTHFHQSEH